MVVRQVEWSGHDSEGNAVSGLFNVDVTISGSVTHRSRLPWKSGVFAHSTSKAHSFESMRGAPVDFVSCHVTRDNWSSILNSWPLDDTSGIRSEGAGFESSMPMYPYDSSASVDAKAYWRQYAQMLVDKGEPDAYVVIAKEFNLNNRWKITPSNKAQWLQRWREAAESMWEISPDIKTVWCPNEGRPQSGISTNEEAWPGDEYVTVLAPDYYDNWEPVYNWSQSKSRFTGKYGIEWWFNWGINKGKRVGVSEWGVSSGTQWAGHCGGDNPFFIEAMFDLFNRYKEHLEYESYFEEPASYVASSLISQNPNSRAKYQQMISQYQA